MGNQFVLLRAFKAVERLSFSLVLSKRAYANCGNAAAKCGKEKGEE